MYPNPNERLSQAVAEARRTSIHQDVLDRGEDAILSRISIEPKASRWRLAWGLGVSATAVLAMALLLGTPTKASAADLARIAEKGDSALRHVRNYQVQPDGSLKLTLEVYAEGENSRLTDLYGNEITYVDGRVTILYPGRKGVTIESQAHAGAYGWAASAKKVLEINTKDRDYTISVKRGITWQGIKADQYVVEEDVVDGQGKTLHLRLEMMADPTTERPLQVQSDMTGFPRSISKWDYPVPNPSYFKLPMTEKTKVYDLDAQRDQVRKAMDGSGQTIVVDGVSVELYQLWADNDGLVCAVVGANYDCPYNYGVHINRKQVSQFSEDENESSHYAVQKPWVYKDKSVQMFLANPGPGSGDTSYPDHVTLEVPVMKENRLVGWAKFENVRVNRAWNLISLLKPANVPFWYPAQPAGKGASATRAADSRR